MRYIIVLIIMVLMVGCTEKEVEDRTVNKNTSTDTNTSTDIDTDTTIDINTDTDIDTDTNIDTNIDTDTDTDTTIDINTDTNIDTDTDTTIDTSIKISFNVSNSTILLVIENEINVLTSSSKLKRQNKEIDSNANSNFIAINEDGSSVNAISSNYSANVLYSVVSPKLDRVYVVLDYDTNDKDTVASKTQCGVFVVNLSDNDYSCVKKNTTIQEINNEYQKVLGADKKPIQFDKAGNAYFMGRDVNSNDSKPILYKHNIEDNSLKNISADNEDIEYFSVLPNGDIVFRSEFTSSSLVSNKLNILQGDTKIDITKDRWNIDFFTSDNYETLMFGDYENKEIKFVRSLSEGGVQQSVLKTTGFKGSPQKIVLSDDGNIYSIYQDGEDTIVYQILPYDPNPKFTINFSELNYSGYIGNLLQISHGSVFYAEHEQKVEFDGVSFGTVSIIHKLNLKTLKDTKLLFPKDKDDHKIELSTWKFNNGTLFFSGLDKEGNYIVTGTVDVNNNITVQPGFTVKESDLQINDIEITKPIKPKDDEGEDPAVVLSTLSADNPYSMSIEFNKYMDYSSVINNTILTNSSTNKVIPYIPIWIYKTMHIIPDLNGLTDTENHLLELGETYKLTLTSDIQDDYGWSIDENKTYEVTMDYVLSTITTDGDSSIIGSNYPTLKSLRPSDDITISIGSDYSIAFEAFDKDTDISSRVSCGTGGYTILGTDIYYNIAFLLDTSYENLYKFSCAVANEEGLVTEINQSIQVLPQNIIHDPRDNDILIDYTTKLIWQDDNEYETYYNLIDAEAYCSSLILGNYTNWKVPSKYEWETMINFNTYFNNVKAYYYWSNTEVIDREGYYYQSKLDDNSYYEYSKGYVKCVHNLTINPPTIELIGDSNITISLGSEINLGAIASDNIDGDLSSRIEHNESAIDTNQIGRYTIVYSVENYAGYRATVSRVVNIREGSVFNNGEALESLVLNLNEEFEIEDISVSDVNDESLSSESIEVTHNIDNTQRGTYTITYSVTNSLGITSTIEREVQVVSYPTLKSLRPSDNINTSIGSDYSIAFEAFDGDTDISSRVSCGTGGYTVSGTDIIYNTYFALDTSYAHLYRFNCAVANDLGFVTEVNQSVEVLAQNISHDPINSDVLIDYTTKLMWQDNNDNDYIYLSDAESYCSSLTLGNYTNWRVPSKYEWETIINFNTLFNNVNTSYYWSNTEVIDGEGNYYQAKLYQNIFYEYSKGYIKCVHDL